MEKIIKNKSIINIEKRMEELEPQSMRYKALEAAKNFKGSWFRLGQFLYSVYKDKLYKEWGFLTFEAYCAKELGIRRLTAVKLLKSYYFIEKEEPQITDDVPAYESVNLLRLAKNNANIDEIDYRKLKGQVFQGNKDYKDVKKEITSIIKSRQEADPEETRQKVFEAKVRRIISTLKSIKLEVDVKNLLPEKVLKQIDILIGALEKLE